MEKAYHHMLYFIHIMTRTKGMNRVIFSLVALLVVGMQFVVAPAVPAGAISPAAYYGPPASDAFSYGTNTTYFYNFTYKMTKTGVVGLPVTIDRWIPTLTNRTILNVGSSIYEQEFRIISQTWTSGSHTEDTDDFGNQFHIFSIPVAGMTTWTFNVQGNLTLRDITWKSQSSVTMGSYNKTDGLYSLYTAEEQYINKSFPLIQTRAVSLNNSNPFTAARNVYDFVKGYLTYNGSMENEEGAEFAIVNKYGDCTEFSYLMVALLRACGIPARVMRGLVIANSAGAAVSPDYRTAVGTKWRYYLTAPDGNKNHVSSEMTGHAWVEYFIPGSGWILSDPTWGNVADYGSRIDNIHVPYVAGVWIGQGISPAIPSPNPTTELSTLPYIFYIYDSLPQTVSYEFTIIHQELSPTLWEQILDFIIKNPLVILGIVVFLMIVVGIAAAIKRRKRNKAYYGNDNTYRERLTFSI